MICKIRVTTLKKGIRVSFKCRTIIGTKILFYKNLTEYNKRCPIDIITHIRSVGSISNAKSCTSKLKSLIGISPETIRTTIVFDLNSTVKINSTIDYANELLDEDDDNFYNMHEFLKQKLSKMSESESSHFGRTTSLTGCK